MDSPNDKWVWQDEDPFDKMLRSRQPLDNEGGGAGVWDESEDEAAPVESNGEGALNLPDPATNLNPHGVAVESFVARSETSVATLAAPSPEPIRLDLHKRNGFHEPVWTTDDILSALDDLGIDLPIGQLAEDSRDPVEESSIAASVTPDEAEPVIATLEEESEPSPLVEIAAADLAIRDDARRPDISAPDGGTQSTAGTTRGDEPGPNSAAGEAVETETSELPLRDGDASEPDVPAPDGGIQLSADSERASHPGQDAATGAVVGDPRVLVAPALDGEPAELEVTSQPGDSSSDDGSLLGGVGEQPTAAALSAPAVSGRSGPAAAAAPAKAQPPASGPAALLAEGLALYQSNHLGEALEALQEARALDPRNLDILTALGTVAVRQNRALEALAAFEAATALEGDAEQALFGRAVSLQLVGWLAEAEEAFQRFLDRVPQCDDALVNLLTVAQAQGRKEVIIDVCERLLTHRPNAEPALRALLLLELAGGNAGDSAIKLGEQIATRNPDSFEAKFNLGLAYFQAGRATEAEASFAEALRVRPQSREALLALAIAQERAGQTEQALATYEVALDRTTSDTAWLNLALLAVSRGDLVFAESKLEECVKRFPDSKAALFHLGTVRLDCGEHRQAAESDRKSVV